MRPLTFAEEDHIGEVLQELVSREARAPGYSSVYCGAPPLPGRALLREIERAGFAIVRASDLRQIEGKTGNGTKTTKAKRRKRQGCC